MGNLPDIRVNNGYAAIATAVPITRQHRRLYRFAGISRRMTFDCWQLYCVVIWLRDQHEQLRLDPTGINPIPDFWHIGLAKQRLSGGAVSVNVRIDSARKKIPCLEYRRNRFFKAVA